MRKFVLLVLVFFLLFIGIVSASDWELSYDLVETRISSLAVFEDKLYAGTENNGKIFVFDGSTWSESYDSTETQILSLAVFDDKLYAGTGLGGKIFVFDGSTWSESYDSTETRIHSLAVFDDKLYAGTANGGKVFVFDGSNWSESYDSTETQIYSLGVFDNKLYAGTGGNGKILVFDGSSWSESYDSTETRIFSLGVFDDKLYAGSGDDGKVFVFDGSSWSESYDSTEDYILSLAVYGNKLYAGYGNGGKILVFDGSSWSESYDSTETYIWSLGVFDNKLYAGTGDDGKVFVYLMPNTPPSITISEVEDTDKFTNEYITIELNIYDPDSNSFLIDLNYSLTNNIGTGTNILTDANTDNSFLCEGLFYETSKCYYDIPTTDLNEGNFYFLIKISDGIDTNTATSNLFTISDSYIPPFIPDTSLNNYSKQYINEDQPINDGNFYTINTEIKEANDLKNYLLVFVILLIGVFCLWILKK